MWQVCWSSEFIKDIGLTLIFELAVVGLPFFSVLRFSGKRLRIKSLQCQRNKYFWMFVTCWLRLREKGICQFAGVFQEEKSSYFKENWLCSSFFVLLFLWLSIPFHSLTFTRPKHSLTIWTELPIREKPRNSTYYWLLCISSMRSGKSTSLFLSQKPLISYDT